MKSLSDTTGDYLTYEEDENSGTTAVWSESTFQIMKPMRRLAYYGLQSLQHRGQESTGIAVSDGEKVEHYKKMGLVADVYNHETLAPLKGYIAIGHVLYSTSGHATIENAQPFVSRSKLGTLAVAHNGSLVNAEPMKEFLEETGSTFTSASDTEVIIKLIAKNYKKGLEKALTDTIQLIRGSFALAVMTEKTLIGARDPNGIRPLCLGKLPNGWILASESCAIDAMGGDLVRDIEPGEIVIINDDGVLSFNFGEKTARKNCIFEYVYFARPDSIMDNIHVLEARIRMGEVLARESGVAADVVIGVPDSGLGAAIGFSRASGIPYAMGLVKNKYIGRTFIAPTQEEREQMVFVKLNAIKYDVCGKRVVIIDDSIVRGTTARRLIQILRKLEQRKYTSASPLRRSSIPAISALIPRCGQTSFPRPMTAQRSVPQWAQTLSHSFQWREWLRHWKAVSLNVPWNIPSRTDQRKARQTIVASARDVFSVNTPCP